MKHQDLVSLKNNICQSYLNFYNKYGFQILPPLPLDNKDDITLDFTNCTICTAKNNLINRIPGEDYVMFQPCMRNTHIDQLGNVNTKDYFLSYFTMIGGFKYYKSDMFNEEFSKVIKSEFDFLSHYGNQIILTIPVQYKKYLPIDELCKSYLEHNNCTINYSYNDEKNLKWKYGIYGVKGYGTRWEISNGGDLVNFGNTINVYADNKPFGIDFGGGVESLIYANQCLKSSIYANTALTDQCSEFCEINSQYEKIIDCVVSIMCILNNKQHIILRDRYILDLYLRLLYSLIMVYDISEEKILSLVIDVNKCDDLVLCNEQIVYKFACEFEKEKKNFDILINSSNIYHILKLIDLCYNKSDDNWLKHKKIIMSHYSKYFSNLSEIDLLAIQKVKKIK